MIGIVQRSSIVGRGEYYVVSTAENEAVKRDDSWSIATAQIEVRFIPLSIMMINPATPVGCRTLLGNALSVVFAKETGQSTRYFGVARINRGT